MKIYSYTNKPKINNVDSMKEYLKQFKGKELWAKVGIGSDYNLFYVRVLDVTDTTLTCNSIEAILIDEFETYLSVPEDIDRLDVAKKYDMYDIEVPENNDLNVYSTQEIVEILESTLGNW